MVDRSGEVVDALHRRNIDFCCAQETRWKNGSARMLGAIGRRYKLLCKGCNKGTVGVGVFIVEKCEAGDAPQVCLSAEEKDTFWDSFIIVLSGLPKQESIFIGSDMNGHVGRDADGYGGVVVVCHDQVRC